MLDERSYRGPRFRPGMAIQLADGQAWVFPSPPDDLGMADGPDPAGAAFGPDYIATVEGVIEAEDRPEQLRAELALAIELLGQNYRLGPEEFRRILEFPPGSPALAAAQRDFHLVALDHARRYTRARAASEPSRAAIPDRLPRWSLPSRWHLAAFRDVVIGRFGREESP